MISYPELLDKALQRGAMKGALCARDCGRKYSSSDIILSLTLPDQAIFTVSFLDWVKFTEVKYGE